MPRSDEDIQANIKKCQERHADKFGRKLTDDTLCEVLEDIVTTKAIADCRGQFSGWEGSDVVRAIESLKEKPPAKTAKAKTEGGTAAKKT